MSGIDIAAAILAADGPVVAVTNSISPIVAPEAFSRPALVLHLVKEDDDAHLGGANWYPVASIIVDSLGSTFGEANSLGDLVKAALIDYAGTIAGAAVSYILPSGIDHFDRGDRGDAWRRRLGFNVRYRMI